MKPQKFYHWLKHRGSANMFYACHTNGKYRKYTVTKFVFPVREYDNEDGELLYSESGVEKD